MRNLRLALTGSGRVDAALRACAYRNPIFFSVLFHESMTELFSKDGDIREITAFVARVRAARGPTAAFPSREAEGVLRAILGEAMMIGQADPHAVSYLEIAIALMTELFAEWQPTADEVAALMSRSETVAAEKGGQPLVAEHEDRWFAAGMPDSPFAALDEPVSDDETES